MPMPMLARELRPASRPRQFRPCRVLGVERVLGKDGVVTGRCQGSFAHAGKAEGAVPMPMLGRWGGREVGR